MSKAPGTLVLLRAVASGKHWLRELHDAYRQAGFGGWGSMATNTRLRRMCGNSYSVRTVERPCYRGDGTYKARVWTRKQVTALLERTKERSPYNVVQWKYTLTQAGRDYLQQHAEDA